MDEFRVIYRDSFVADLGRIVKSIASYNPEAAHKLGSSILARSGRLSFFPDRHPRVRQRPMIRRLIVQKYFKVFYRVRYETRVVEVLRCWDGRQGSDPVT